MFNIINSWQNNNMLTQLVVNQDFSREINRLRRKNRLRKRVKKFGEPFALFGVAKMGKTDEDIQGPWSVNSWAEGHWY